MIFTNIPIAHGVEPPKTVADEMLKYDVILMPTTKSLTHTKATERARKNGARIATMPGITKKMMKTALNVDFRRIKKMNHSLMSKLKEKNSVIIKTKLGTDIEFELKGRKWLGDDGLYTKKGDFGNLPAGEVFTAPLEGKTNGKIVVDASIGGIGKVDKNIRIDVKNGFIVNMQGGKVANQFKKSLKSYRSKASGELKNQGFLSNKLYKNVAELGIGTNYKAKITGNVLEDEKVAGTCHIAFGNNKHFGGKVDVPFHVDVVVKKPTIYADDVLMMKDGKIENKKSKAKIYK